MIFQKKAADYRSAAPDPERRRELRLFERTTGTRFKREDLLNLAFSHRSFAHESSQNIGNNERLEFLGDSVLGAVVSEYLFTALPDRNEGDLAKIKSFVVSEDSLADVAKNLKIDNFILIGKGEEYSGGRSKKAILADCLEAIIGAYYLDSGFRKCRDFVLKFMIPEIMKVLENKHRKDFKTLLQEHVQKVFKTYPKYVLVQKTGPDHDKTFRMEVKIRDASYGPGEGKNKKEAEQAAASIAYRDLTGEASPDE
ncbi:MAG: ribonuclease III [Spirochaetales bacterium]|nr:ribonuclease III [Spirochaetales bacterium]